MLLFSSLEIVPVRYSNSNGLVRLAQAAAIASFFLAPLSAVAAPVIPANLALSAQAIQQFLANPSALLTQYPDGGPQMIDEVYKLAGTDPATLQALLGLLKSANPKQASAIGTGLGKIAVEAVKTNQAYATLIQQAVVAAQSASALVAFDAAIGGNIQLTAAAGGGGTGGGGEAGTGSSGTFGGYFAGSPLNLYTAATNTVDSFTLNSFTPSSAVSSSTP